MLSSGADAVIDCCGLLRTVGVMNLKDGDSRAVVGVVWCGRSDGECMPSETVVGVSSFVFGEAGR